MATALTDNEVEFYCSCKAGDLAKLNEVLKYYPKTNVNTKNEAGGWTPLIIACDKGFIDIVKKLLKLNADVDIQSNFGWTALYHASYEGHLDIVHLLLEHGCQVNTPNKEGKTAVFCAFENDHFTVVDALKVAGADINVKADENGDTLLHMAVINQDTQKMERLLAMPNVDLETVNNDGSTALHQAVITGFTDGIALLIGAMDNFSALDKNGCTAFHLAVNKSDFQTMKLLLQAVDSQQQLLRREIAAVKHAFNSGLVEIIAFLETEGFLVHGFVDTDGNTALHLACHSDANLALVELLLLRGDIDINRVNNDCEHALHISVSRQSLACAERLLKVPGVNIESPNNDGATPLFAAVSTGIIDAVKLLLRHGALVATPNKIGVLPICVAVEKEHVTIVSELLAAGADPNSEQPNCEHAPDTKRECQLRIQGDPLLFLALSKNNQAMVKLLIDNKCDLNIVSKSTGGTILMERFAVEHMDIAKLLISAGADVNAMNAKSQTPLFCAFAFKECNPPRCPEYAALLINAGADIHFWKLVGETTYLAAACSNNLIELVILLLEKGAKQYIDFQRNDGVTALLIATSKGFTAIVDVLVKAGADLSLQHKASKFTAVQLAANNSATPKELIAILKNAENIANEAKKAEAEAEAKRYAICNNIYTRFSTGKWLDPRHGAITLNSDLVEPNTPSFNLLCSAFWFAAGAEPEEFGFIKCLADVGVHDYRTDRDHDSSLQRAVKCGNCKTAAFLIAAGMNANDISKKNDQRSVLQLAATSKKNNDTDMIALLVSLNADINFQDAGGNTALHLAVKQSHLQIVQYLLQCGADLTVQNNDGQTALHLACESTGDHVLEELVEFGADPNLQDKSGNTACHLAAANATWPLHKLQVLCNAGADFTVRNEDSKLPVDIVATLDSRLKEWFISPKPRDVSVADVKAQPTVGNAETVAKAMKTFKAIRKPKPGAIWSFLYDACKDGHMEGVSHISATYGLSAACLNFVNTNEHDRTCLIIAAFNGHTSIVDVLLVAGSQCNTQDKLGFTALYMAVSAGHTDVVARLLSAPNIDVNLMTNAKQTALFVASQTGNIEVVKMLLSAGADKDIKDKDNRTAADVICEGKASNPRIKIKIRELLVPPIVYETPPVSATPLMPVDAGIKPNSSVPTDDNTTTSATCPPAVGDEDSTKQSPLAQFARLAPVTVQVNDEQPLPEPVATDTATEAAATNTTVAAAVVTEESQNVETTGDSVVIGDKVGKENMKSVKATMRDEAYAALLSEMQAVQPQLNMIQTCELQLHTLSQASPQTLAYLTTLGNAGVVADQQYQYIFADPLLYKYYITFNQSVSSAILASQAIASGMVDNSDQSLTEKCVDWIDYAASASGVPCASFATSVCKYLIKIPNDIHRAQCIQRITATFPGTDSHKFIEILSRELTILLEHEIRSVATAPPATRNRMFATAKRVVHWLQTYEHATPVSSFAHQHASLLIDKLMTTDPPVVLSFDNIWTLMEWAVNSDIIGGQSIVSLLATARGDPTLSTKATTTDGNKSQMLSNTTADTQPPSLTDPLSPPPPVDTTRIPTSQVQHGGISPLVPIVVEQVAELETMRMKLATMEENQRVRDAEAAFQRSESQKAKKELEDLKKQVKKLNVISDVLGGGEQLTAQNQESLHVKMSKNIETAAANNAILGELITRTLRLEDACGIEPTDRIESAISPLEAAANKAVLMCTAGGGDAMIAVATIVDSSTTKHIAFHTVDAKSFNGPVGMSVALFGDNETMIAVQSTLTLDNHLECSLCSTQFRNDTSMACCPCCVIVSCLFCLKRQVYEVSSKQIVSVCVYCHEKSTRIRSYNNSSVVPRAVMTKKK